MNAPKGQTNPVKTAQILFFVNAAIWLLIGVISMTRILASSSGQHITALVIAILMLGNVGAMLIAGIGIGKRNRWFYYFGILVLLINIILTITDQFGILDFVTLVFDVILLGFLIITRSHFVTIR